MEDSVPPLDSIAALKVLFGFLFCDETHRFLSLCSRGKSCIDHWNSFLHATAPATYPRIPGDLFDLRTATLYKAIGGLSDMNNSQTVSNPSNIMSSFI